MEKLVKKSWQGRNIKWRGIKEYKSSTGIWVMGSRREDLKSKTETVNQISVNNGLRR